MPDRPRIDAATFAWWVHGGPHDPVLVRGSLELAHELRRRKAIMHAQNKRWVSSPICAIALLAGRHQRKPEFTLSRAWFGTGIAHVVAHPCDRCGGPHIAQLRREAVVWLQRVGLWEGMSPPTSAGLHARLERGIASMAAMLEVGHSVPGYSEGYGWTDYCSRECSDARAVEHAIACDWPSELLC